MLYREIMAVCSVIHIKHINTLCGQNQELLNVNLAVYKYWSLYGTYSDHWATKASSGIFIHEPVRSHYVSVTQYYHQFSGICLNAWRPNS